MSIADKITRLTTARNNIRTALANKGVAASSHGFESFAGDIGSIQTGITPNGTKNITANGTYDVTQFASAAVNVAELHGTKVWDITIPTDVFSGDIVMANDQAVADHYNDENAFAMLIKKTIAAVGNTYPHIISMNRGYNGVYSFNQRYNAAATALSPNAVAIALGDQAGYRTIIAKSNGDIGYYAASASYGIAAGDYALIFSW